MDEKPSTWRQTQFTCLYEGCDAVSLDGKDWRWVIRDRIYCCPKCAEKHKKMLPNLGKVKSGL